jgi:hypothetical protein
LRGELGSTKCKKRFESPVNWGGNNMNIRLIKYYLLLFICAITLYNCTDVPEGTLTNMPPDTHLSLFPDSIISPQITRIRITWWGDDPDGLIKGYRFSFDSTNWTYSEGNDSTFQLVIVGNDSTFRFWVAAVDDKDNIPNSCNKPVPGL